MKRGFLAPVGLLAFVGLFATAAQAEPFKCPHVGGNFVFGQEANINTLDQMTSSTISTRNIAMNIYESLMTRDENNHPILELAASMDESPDHLTYTFKLRQGVHFHNGKLMTSADVVASFDRYAKVGNQRSTLDNVDRWDAPDAATFVIHMKKIQPTFIEALSSFSVPIVIIPAENRDVPAQQLTQPIGTGPYQLVESVPGSEVKLKRFDGYKPNTSFQERTGFGGYKQACFDTVTFRIVTEPGARVAGLRTGELQGVEDVPAKSVADLKNDKNITILPLKNWWIQIANPNISNPPTDKLLVRKAIQAALDMDEIMDAASDGNYQLNVGFQYPNQPDYTDAGKETYNLHNPELAKKYLAEAGYQGRAGDPADQQGLPADVQLGAGDAAAASGGRHQRADEGRGLADIGPDDAEHHPGLEFPLHRLGHAAGAGRAGDHAVPGAAERHLQAGGWQGRPRRPGRMERHEHAADRRRTPTGLRPDAEIGAGSGLCDPVRLIHQGPGGPVQREGFVPLPHTPHVQRLVQPLTVA